MPSLQERLAAAAGPAFKVGDLLGRGGMGAVYRAFDRDLQRWVAIKVLLPEFATEVAERRFLREARTLASLKHQNIIPIYLVKQAEGLSFFVMELVEGVTLADKLCHGPLSANDAKSLGNDLLEAVTAVHRREIVHCDIKPSNIFTTERGVLLGDFGIATASPDSDATRTRRGIVGTPMYMAPEQSAGHEPTFQTDIYGVGLVLYESLTGNAWNTGDDPQDGDWADVPNELRNTLSKALEVSPSKRWGSAEEFRRHLTTRTERTKMVAGLAAIVLGVLGVVGYLQSRSADRLENVVRIEAQNWDMTSGRDSVLSLAMQRFYDGLSGAIDFTVCREADRCDEPRVTIRVNGSHRGDSLFLQVRSTEQIPVIYWSGSATDDAWSHLGSEAGAQTLLQLWQDSSAIFENLPNAALPHSTEGMEDLIVAEQLWHESRFTEAKSAYVRAINVDATCFLCSWRVTEMQRWLQEAPDSVQFQRTVQNLDSFPPHYRLLIEARRLPVDDRLTLLRRAVETGNDFFLTHFAYGDELFHRGALIGSVREEAAYELYQSALARPQFTPAWEHAAWAYTALGDTMRASEVMARLDSLPPRDEEATLSRLLHTTAYTLRFAGDEERDNLLQVLPRFAGDRRIDVGPRLMSGFALPEGAVLLGGSEVYDGRYPGLFARYLGYVAMGQLDAARLVAANITSSFGVTRNEVPAFAAQMEIVLWMVDQPGTPVPDSLTRVLRELDWNGLDSHQQESAALTLLLAAPNAPGELRAAVSDDRLAALASAMDTARAGAWRVALRLSEPLVRAELEKGLPGNTGRDDDWYPFFRTLLYASRADWLESIGEIDQAIGHLRWHEYTDMYRLPLGPPTSYEVDWVMSGVSGWRRARLMDSGNANPELCRLYAEVARIWRDGVRRYAERAESAGARWMALCATGGAR